MGGARKRPDPAESRGGARRAAAAVARRTRYAHRHQRFSRPRRDRRSPCCGSRHVPRRTPVAVACRLEPLPRIRLAEPFEQLRDASDRMPRRVPARGRKSSSPLSARRRLHRARDASPRISSKPAASKRSATMASRAAHELIAALRRRPAPARLSVRVGRGLRDARRQRRRRRSSGRRAAHLSRRPAGRARSGATATPACRLHLRRLRCARRARGRPMASLPADGKAIRLLPRLDVLMQRG